MHYHTEPQAPDDQSKAYCEVHAKLWMDMGEMMYVCECDKGEMEGCAVCIEEY